MDENLARRLSRAANRAGLTETVFVTTMLKRQVNVFPLLSPFGGIRLSKRLFREILGQANQSTMEIVASEIALEEIPLAFDLLKLDRNVSSLIWFMKEILDDVCGWFHLETETPEEIISTHDFGYRWSLFLKAYLTNAYESLFKRAPRIFESDHVVRMDLLPD